MADPEVPGWQFEIREQSRPFPAWFSRPEPDLAFDSGYLDKDRALQRLLRRLNDYDGDIFRPDPGPSGHSEISPA